MKTPLLAITILLLTLTGFSQAGNSPSPKARSDARERLFAECAFALPRLYAHKDFDSIAWYVQQRWQQGPTDPDLLCLAILLAIERRQFDLTDFSDQDAFTEPFIAQLRGYADVLDPVLKRRAPLHYHAHRGFDATAADRALFYTTYRWAGNLLCNRQLDSVEKFLCRVYAGNIRYPDADLWEGKITVYPAESPEPGDSTLTPYGTAAPPSAAAEGEQASPPRSAGAPHEGQRAMPPRRLAGVLTIGTGIWVPQGHLSALGVHPAISYGFGARNKYNEWDIDASLRFVSTPSSYTVIRNDSAYSRNFYEGGFVGLDYTRYLVHGLRWEAGPIIGTGVDFFDIDNGNDEFSYLSPSELTAFNFNIGLRYNYFITPRCFLWISARYHFLHYNNPGGTPLDGNAFSLEIIIGATNKRFP
jgi:hypothetical protein